jgi:hypothetical protein
MCKFCGVVKSANGIGFTQQELNKAYSMGLTWNAIEKRIRRGATKNRALFDPPNKQRNRASLRVKEWNKKKGQN